MAIGFTAFVRRTLAISSVTAAAIAMTACSGDAEPTDGSPGPTPTGSTPAPDPETTPPAPDGDYQQAITEFCATAGQTRSSLEAIAGAASIDVAALTTVEQTFHDAFADLFAAHELQFGTDLNGVEPLDSGFAVDASIAMLTAQAQADGETAFAPGDPIFSQLDDVAAGCAAQGAPT